MNASELIRRPEEAIDDVGDKRVVDASGKEFHHVDTDPGWPDEIVLD